MDNDSIGRIRQVFEDLNRPAKSRLATALKARGIAYTTKALDEVVGKSTDKQLEAPAYRYTGNIASADVNERWACDTIDLTQYPSKAKGMKEPMRYIVVAQDIFTRKIFAEASPSVSPAVVSAIFERFVAQHGVPKSLITDGGEEYTNLQFTNILKRLKILHQVKPKASKNDFATLDRAHGTLKKALQIKKGGWADRLDAVVSGMNSAPHAGVANLAPNKVEGATDTRFQLQKQNIEKMAENAEAIQKRANALQKTGAFRVEIPPPKNGYRRTTDAQFSGEVHRVAQIQEGGRVLDTKGESFQTKFTRPVDKDSKTVEDAKVQTTRDKNQREMMLPFVTQLFTNMGPNSSQTVTKAGTFLRGLPNFIAKTREAGLSQKSVIATTLRLFPEFFEVKTPATGGAATVQTKERGPLQRRLS